MLTIIPHFLTEDDVQRLRVVASLPYPWEVGRQGTGYEKLNLRSVMGFHDLAIRCITMLGPKIHEDHWDMYILRYPNGSYIPPHKDEATIFGLKHKRLNAIIKEPDDGGILVVEGARLYLTTGTAIVFYPDQIEHAVTMVSGERLVLSVGAWLTE